MIIISLDDSAGQLISPPKSAEQVETESKQGSELYKISHGAYDVGEMVGVLLTTPTLIISLDGSTV